MKTTAAVLVATGQPLEIAELTVPPLQPGQALVELNFSGVCHTQLLECRGHRGPDRFLPHCLGHEGSGMVLEVGDDAAKCQPGQPVILSWIKGSGRDVPGCRYSWRDQSVNAGGVTTFMTHAVVSENRLTPLPAGCRPDVAALIGCAAATGTGSVWHTANVQPGQSLAVFGCGGVGLCAVGGAAISQARLVAAVDVHPARLELARQFGATLLIDASRQDPVAALQQLEPAGLDWAIEASGRPAVMRQALAVVRSRGGWAIVVGNARQGELLELDPRELNQGKGLIGTWGGDSVPERDFGRIAELTLRGQLALPKLVGRTYSLEQVNEALADLEQGTVARPLITMK